MDRRRIAIVFLALLCLWPLGAAAAPEVPEAARSEGILVGGEPRAEVRLLSDARSLRPGDAFSVGVLFTLEPGWHIYWHHPGDAGLPTEVEWTLSGAEQGEMQWPAPDVFEEGDGLLTTYGYHDQVLLFVPARARETGESLEISAEVEYLACKHECIPAEASLRRSIPISSRTEPADDEVLRLFQRYAERIPATAEALDLEVQVLYSQDRIRPGDSFRVALAVVACKDHTDLPHECPAVRAGTRQTSAVFVPDRIPGVKLKATDGRPHPLVPSGWLVNLDGKAGAEEPAADQRLAGVLALKRGDGSPVWVEIDVPLLRAPAGSEVAHVEHPWLAPRTYAIDLSRPGLPLWQAILLGLAGGVILNLMPCVLPVLAIKIFSLTQLAHEGRRTILLHGASYLTGTVVSMLLLALTILVLKTAGMAVGWGFQFQEPLFVAGLSGVLLLFALNLFGIFEIYTQGGRLGQLGATSAGLRRSLFEGLLAVVVATPCTAPFLGTAVGFALASPAFVIFAIFAAIGTGLALPFVLVTLFPAWSRIIPRPGPWMEVMKIVLGFGLLGTVVWLVRIIGGSAGIDGVTRLLVFLLALAAVTWLYGTLQRSRRVRPGLALALAVTLIGATGLYTLRIDTEDADRSARGSELIAWRPFDKEEIAAELAQGRTVFVDFTADWCITCGVNERLVIESSIVLHELERLNVATFKADWTRRNETIRLELARYGRAGVPMYLVYGPEAPDDPALLPELLTINVLIDALRRASPHSAALPFDEKV